MMMMMIIILLFISSLFITVSTSYNIHHNTRPSFLLSCSNSSYFEDVFIQQFSDGKVLISFEHHRWINHNDFWIYSYNGHFNLLPRSIGEAFIKHQVEEFELAFTQGKWNYEKWGITTNNNLQPAPSGVTLSTVFKNSSDVDALWKSFTHSLSGLFCASLNFMDEAKTVDWSPMTGVNPWNDTKLARSKYSSLPREAVCTENLTPWTKLLPCQTKAGIASLYNSYKVYDANYHSLATSIVSACQNEECSESGLMFTQTLTVVLDPVRLYNSKDWSFSTLLDRKLSQSCPVSSSSRIKLKLPVDDSKSMYKLLEKVDDSMVDYESGFTLYEYDFSQKKNLNVGLHWFDESIDYVTNSNASPLSIRRSATGFGQERGGFNVKIVNHYETEFMEITYYEYIPWFLKVYLHTYKVDFNPPGILKNLSVQPAIDRKRPTIIQARILLAPNNSMTELSFEFDMAFIKYTEHPPDANRGFDVASAIVIIHNNNSSRDIRIFTEPILVSLPAPDFSMPYNVITMTCTLIALFFGSTFNMLTRSYTPARSS